MEMRQRCARRIAAGLVPLALLALGDAFVLERGEAGPTDPRIRGDARHYVAMVEGRSAEAPAPFKYRVLAPLVARALPWSPADALRIVTYASLAGFYAVALALCAQAGLSPAASVAGLALVFLSPWHLYHFHNPFLTDAPALLAISVAVLALAGGSFGVFLAASAAGVLTREAVSFLVPAWIVRDPGRGALAAGVGLGVWLAPRLLVPDENGLLAQPIRALHAVLREHGAVGLVVGMGASWGHLWWLLPLGLLRVPRERRSLAAALAFLLAGAFVASLFAVDTGRMFATLSPLFVVAVASVADALLRRRRLAALGALFAVALAGAVVERPNAVIGSDSPLFPSRWPDAAVFVLGSAVSLVCALRLRGASGPAAPV